MDDKAAADLVEANALWPGLSEELFAETYDQLRSIASRRLNDRRSSTVNTTLVVHEAWLKLSANGNRRFNSHAHYLATASRAMRQFLVDHLRAKLAAKRGSGLAHIDIEDADIAVSPLELGVLDIDAGLEKLGEHSPHLVRVVECRFFAGLTVGEAAEALDRSPRTIERDWAKARIYLSEYLRASTKD